MRKFFRIILKFLLGIFVVFTLLFTILAIFKIPIQLDTYKQPVEVLASKLLNRPVKIEKSVIITTSLQPIFTMEGLRIKNPTDFDQETFMYLETAQIQLELLPLLQKKIHIAKFKVQKLHLNLTKKIDGKINWIFTPQDVQEDQEPKPESSTPKHARDLDISGDSIVVKKLDLQDISITYVSPDNEQPLKYHLEKCSGLMLPNEPLKLDFLGAINDSFPYTVGISISSLDEFITKNSSWMTITAEIADTTFSFKGDVNLAEAHQSVEVDTEISGDNLNSLNGLLRLDLPPLTSYKVATKLLVKHGYFKMKDLDIITGSSKLKGKAIVTKDDQEIFAEIDLDSTRIQLNDFVFDEWSYSEGTSQEDAEQEAPEERTKPDSPPIVQENEQRKLADPEFLNKFDATISINADEVLSGDDKLGEGSLKVSLQKGRISFDPLQIELPGGSINLSASLTPGIEESEATFKAKVENFDIGILARRKKPDTDMSGLVNLDVDVQAKASTFSHMLANGNGYFDFSGQLQNINSGLIDLWAVNLVTAIVSQTDQNQINCAVARWTAKDGILTPDVFFIDTSQIRICGKGEINFKTGDLKLTIAPTAKEPEFFSLSTPLDVRGSFSDIKLGVRKSALFGTAFIFATSPIHVPIRRVTNADIPRDGGDACNIELGPDNREDISISGCY